MESPDRLVLMQEEHAAWRAVVEASRGVTITEADWRSSIADTSTPGCRLIDAIRKWGEALVALRSAQ